MKCWLFERIVLPTDDKQVIFSKKILFLAGAVGFVSYLSVIVTLHNQSDLPGVVAAMLGGAALATQLLVERRIREGFVEIVMYTLTFSLTYSDLMEMSAVTGARSWPYFVLIIDLCLVCRLPRHVSRNIIIMVLLWLFVIFLESVYRFGLFDLWFLVSQDKRLERVTCSALPCKLDINLAINISSGQILVFLLDFYFTRGFARDLREEHDKMNKVIAATEDIATSFSRFDLEAAEAIISTASLPPPLYDSFSKILENLKDYRPYLPDALFHNMHSEGQIHGKDIPVPGLQSEQATLVFTDIQGSTATWEACPEGMKEGLQVHNQAIRDCIAEHNGYEVKTIGDSFMVAFESTSDAVWFGLSVQERLVNSVWPEELLDTVDHCSWDAEGPWCGLRVRVGVHCGDVSVQLNNLTGRYDYFGNTVNKAARMEGVCVGGAVAVTPEVMNDVKDAVFALGATSLKMGEIQLKGIGAVQPYLLLPSSLLGRKAYVQRQLQAGMKTSCQSISTPTSHSRSQTAGPSNARPTMANSTSATASHVEVVLERYETESEISGIFNNRLAKILTCTERSHGAVVSLQGNRVAVCWNCTKPCPTHVENSLVFVKMLGVSADFGGEASIHVGMSTSTMFHGTVGNKKQLFVTVLGTGVVVSSSLCSDAVAKDVLCYYTSPFEIDATEGLTITERATPTAAGSTVQQVVLSCTTSISPADL